MGKKEDRAERRARRDGRPRYDPAAQAKEIFVTATPEELSAARDARRARREAFRAARGRVGRPHVDPAHKED
jgi:hypothetical protein